MRPASGSVALLLLSASDPLLVQCCSDAAAPGNFETLQSLRRFRCAAEARGTAAADPETPYQRRIAQMVRSFLSVSPCICIAEPVTTAASQTCLRLELTKARAADAGDFHLAVACSSCSYDGTRCPSDSMSFTLLPVTRMFRLPLPRRCSAQCSRASLRTAQRNWRMRPSPAAASWSRGARPGRCETNKIWLPLELLKHLRDSQQKSRHRRPAAAAL